jgi:hypothetical protein
LVEGNYLVQPLVLHECGVVGVGERKIQGQINLEDPAESALAWQAYPGQLNEREYGLLDRRSRVMVLPLEREHGLEDHRVGSAYLDLSLLDPSEKGRRAGRVIRMVLEQVAQKHVGVEKRRGHLAPHPFHHIIRDNLLGRGS